MQNRSDFEICAWRIMQVDTAGCTQHRFKMFIIKPARDTDKREEMNEETYEGGSISVCTVFILSHVLFLFSLKAKRVVILCPMQNSALFVKS